MSEVTNIIQPDQLNFIFLTILSLLNIALCFKAKIPLVNFVVGCFSIGMAAVTIGDTALPFNGYIQMFTLLMAAMSMLAGVKELRG